MALRILLTLFLLSFTLCSCLKDIPKGTPITTSGTVIDTVLGQTVQGATVYLVGGFQTPAGTIAYFDALDSALTDAQGHFFISYTATGNFVDYGVMISPANRELNTPVGQTIPDTVRFWYPFNFVHSLNGVVLRARLVKGALLSLHIDNNAYDTLLVRVYGNPHDYHFVDTVFGTKADISLTIPCVPLDTTFVRYEVRTSFLNDSLIGSYRMGYDTYIYPISGSVPPLTKSISSTYDLPLYH